LTTVSEEVCVEAIQIDAKLKRETMDEDIMAQNAECSALRNRMLKDDIRVIIQMSKSEGKKVGNHRTPPFG
jgi:hypothetical protein